LFGELHGRLLKGVRGNRQKALENFAIGKTILGHLAQRSLMPGLCTARAGDETGSLRAFENFLHGPSERPFLIDLALVATINLKQSTHFACNGRVGPTPNSLLLANAHFDENPCFYLSAYFEKHRNDIQICCCESAKGGLERLESNFSYSVAEQAMDRRRTRHKLMHSGRITGKRLQTARASISGRLGRSIVYAAGDECRLARQFLRRLFLSAQNM